MTKRAITKCKLGFRALYVANLTALLILILSGIFFASANAAPEPANLDIVGAHEVLTIRFEKPIYHRTNLKQHITVRDPSRKAVKVSAAIGDDGTSIIIRPPAGGYKPGMTYTVRVKSTLRSQSGKRLMGKPITKRFKIAVDVGDGNAALPVVGSFERLKQLLADSAALRPNPMMRGGIVVTTGEVVFLGGAADGRAESAGAVSGNYSTTNVQVEGVDESDIVKTDGAYIYQVNNRRIVVARATPAAKIEIADMIKLDDPNFNPAELYVDNTHLVIIGTSYREMPLLGDPTLEDPVGILPTDGSRIMMRPFWLGGISATRVLVYDLTDKENIGLVHDLELEGNLISSRKIDAVLYLVASKDIYLYEGEEGNSVEIRPSYRDSAAGGAWIPLDYSDIRYFPNSIDANYLLIAGLNLKHPEEPAKISSYLGAGQNIYMSGENLYVAASRYHSMPFVEVAEAPAVFFEGAESEKTDVFKFSLDNGQADFSGKGQVPGTILNQFSMDEFKDHFRIATTTGEVWRVGDGENTSQNHVYVLDPSMTLIGQLNDIAPGERIYSTRFMGDRLYMVTFRQVDPFFVIDLKDPTHPAILGALKIPGFSDYLHPYDENHILGFGRDTTAASGMKIALFDVTKVSNPVERFREVIGDWGTYSELLDNHKALLFSQEKNLLAFPVTTVENGAFAFQGAYIYQLDLEKGFQTKGRITHLSDIEPADYWNHSARFIQRILFIGDALYTVSQAEIMAHDLTTEKLAELGSLDIPPEGDASLSEEITQLRPLGVFGFSQNRFRVPPMR